MKISCPSCSAKYSIADEKVQNRLAKIRCRKCGTSIVIDGNVSPAHVYAADGAGAVAGASAPAAAPSTDAGTVYSVDLGENDQRQMGVPEIVAAYNAGMVSAETFVWADGFADWTALAQVEELVAALHAAAQNSPTALTDETSAASASTAPDESPWDHQPASGGSGGGADLFGNVASAGGLQDHSPAAMPAAERSPFGGGGGLADATGARNESSVLFSLSALTSSASTSRPSVPAPAAAPGGNNDDSGLIDLRALTAAAEATAHIPNAVAARPVQMPLAAAPLGGSPLGMSPLGGGLGVGPSIPPQAAKGNNNVLIIGGFLFAGIVAAAAIMTLGGKDEEPAVAPPAPALVAPAPAPVPTALPTAQTGELPTADAKPPSTGTEEEESAPKGTTKPSGKPRPKPSGAATGSTSSPQPSASPAPAPKPAASVGRCGCKKDDLMCLMNCAQ